MLMRARANTVATPLPGAGDAPSAPYSAAVSERLAALKSLPWLRDLPDGQLLPLARRCNWLVARKGQTIVEQGQPPEFMAFLVQGRAHAERLGPGQRSVLLQLLQAGDRIGDLAALDGEPHGATVRAVQASRLLQIAQGELLFCLEHSPALCIAFSVAMVDRLRDSNRRIQRLALDPVIERVYSQLQDWSRPAGNGDRLVHEQVSRLELAKLVGASREMVSRAVRTLVRSGRLELRGRRQLVLADGAITPK